MYRRTFLASTAGLIAAPIPYTQLYGNGGLGPSATALDAPDSIFEAWKQGFVLRAAGAGLPADRVGEVLAGLAPDPRVLAADQRQPELSRSMGDYLAASVSQARIDAGARRRLEGAAWMDPIADQHGVPAEILVAIWGVESNFGQNQGDFDVVRSLATLAAEGRRRTFGESQLQAALTIIFRGDAPRERLKGSWAGAMGQTQFTPEDYLNYAIDADGDGRRDIWGSSADSLGSSGNFLARKASWRRGQGWAREVVLPTDGSFDYGLAEGDRHPWSWWAERGVRPAGGLAWSATDAEEPAGLILPAGWSGPAFLVLPNHFAIRAYNNATTYALAVGLLADRIAGRPGLLAAWPAETPITLADRIAAQQALAGLGFDVGEPDGVLGLKTRAATRAWQRSRNMPADGYLTYGLIQALKTQAGLPPVLSVQPAS
jgi:lytic murein transglycosylase